MKKMTSLLLVLWFLSNLTIANSLDDPSTELSNQEVLRDINDLFNNNNFSDAIPLLREVIQKDSSNYNVHFKLGLCLLKSLDQQEKASIYLQKATKNMSDVYDFSDASIRTAPYDALYFLGKSYLAINAPDSALKNFEAYNDHYHGTPPIATEEQIIMCRNARISIKSPRDVSIIDVGESINSISAEMHPVVTLDNSILFFSSRKLRQDQSNVENPDQRVGMYHEDIYFSVRNKNGGWSTAQFFDHNSAGNDAPLFISPDGLTLYLRREKNNQGDIFKSVFKDGVWTKPEAIGSGINTAFDETGISISGDGQSLYFSSNREGGSGKSDIYQCTKKKNGKWGKPTSLSEVINTPYNELSPFIHPNGKTLFFSTNGNKLKGVGGYDVYYSELNDEKKWSEPQSMGYPINGTNDEFHYYIAGGGIRYYSKRSDKKSYEIYQIKGGGFDVEVLNIGTEVVTLTEEMDVTEVLEVVEEVETEVEVVETIETEVIVENEVEVIDLESLTEMEGDLSSGGLLDETLEESPESMFAQMELDSISEEDRAKLINKVKSYLSKELENNSSTIFKTIRFNTNSASLDLLNDNEKKVLLDFILNKPKINIKVVGYTDNVGKEGVNLLLSNNRAKVVYDFLIKNGVAKDRIEYYGKGKSNFIDSNSTESGRSNNRRVEVILL